MDPSAISPDQLDRMLRGKPIGSVGRGALGILPSDAGGPGGAGTQVTGAGGPGGIPQDPRIDLLDQAKAVVTGARPEVYGLPEHDLQATAEAWSVYLRRRMQVMKATVPTLQAEDVCVMMILMKSMRLASSPDHQDSKLDIAGYSACDHRVSVIRAQNKERPV